MVALTTYPSEKAAVEALVHAPIRAARVTDGFDLATITAQVVRRYTKQDVAEAWDRYAASFDEAQAISGRELRQFVDPALIEDWVLPTTPGFGLMQDLAVEHSRGNTDLFWEIVFENVNPLIPTMVLAS